MQQLFLPERSLCVFQNGQFYQTFVDLDEVLSQAVDKHEREEAFSNDGLDEILSQSLDMLEEVNLKPKVFGILLCR